MLERILPRARERIGILLMLALALGNPAIAQIAGPAPPLGMTPDTVLPGELVIEPATLINLGFEWLIQGDENRNASVAVAYRREGDASWRDALPMLRLNGERIYSESRIDLVAPSLFAGSVLDLEPDTAYEVRFTIADPDGVVGDAERRAYVRTRAEPVPYAGGRVFHVYPHGFTGEKIEASFEGLLCGYNEWCAGTDWAKAGRPSVVPGVKIVVHAGEY
jgi:hypothetical protein